MWSVFIVLIFGGYYLVKYYNAWCNNDKAQKKIENQDFAQKIWYSSVVDSNLHNWLLEERKSGGYNRQLEEAIDTLRSVTGIKDLNFAPLSRYGKNKFNSLNIENTVEYILSVKMGRLPSMYCSRHVNCIEKALGTKLPKEVKINFLRWVELQLESQGIYGAKLYFVDNDITTWFKWEPFIDDFNHAIRISDEHINEIIKYNFVI